MDRKLKEGKVKLCIFSYNSRGFTEEKQNICKSLFIENESYYPILCNQENFILKGNNYKIKQCLPTAKIFYKEAVKETQEGRPKNGMFIAIPDELKGQGEDVSPQHWRVQAVILSTQKSRIMVINSYFPTDPRTHDFDSTDLLSTLDAIRNVLKDNDYENVVWCGDINADFLRQSPFTLLIDNFIEDRSLYKSWDTFPIDFTHFYDREDETYTSTIDHFFWNEHLSNHITDADAMHLPDNTSDHCPIYCMINLGKIAECKMKSSEHRPRIPSWKMANEEDKLNYVNELGTKLNAIDIPSSAHTCKNVNCEDPSHIDSCDRYLTDILESIRSTASSCLPTPNPKDETKKKPLIYNWNQEVKPFKEEAYFWHAIWESAGKPINTVLHRIMKRTRNIYHYQIRKCRKAAECLKKNTLLNACINDKGDIFKEIKKLRKSTHMTATSIDGIKDNTEEHFAGIYKELYNSVEDREELQLVKKHLKENITQRNITDVNKVTPSIIKEAINKLKNDKTDPVYQFNSQCLKFSPDILHQHLCTLFQTFLTHGHISTIVMISTIIPLVKDNLGDITSSSNYRSIALSSLILKIFDWVLLLLFEKELFTDELQFGFQDKTSTTMCTWLAIETIDYYMRNGSEVFVGVMDMTKAFDKVKQSTLFWKLIKRGISLVFLRLLVDMYSKQMGCVTWNGKNSNTFSIRNGVKQGGVISPRLYCIYTDGLFSLLRQKRTGCWVGDHYVGILGYADDLLLIAPSRDALQEMINTCEAYAKDLNLAFSTHSDPRKSKTKCMAFLKKERDLKNITLGGIELPWVNTAKHLGCKLDDTFNGLKNDLMEKRAIYINKTNQLRQEFYFAHPKTKIRINNIFNSYFYGSPLWDLFGTEAERLEKTWNISLRMMLGIPRDSHRFFLEPMSASTHIMHSLYRRYMKFIDTIRMSTRRSLTSMLEIVMLECRSNTGRNLRRIMKKVNKHSINDIEMKDIQMLTYKRVPDNEDWKVDLAKELWKVKNNDLFIDNFTNDEISDLLIDVTTC